MSANTTTCGVVNGIDTDALRETINAVTRDPKAGKARFCVTTNWKGGTRTESKVSFYELGGVRHGRNFTIKTDEPPELLGESKDPNPQEVLMAGMNSCMMVGCTAVAAMMGVELESVEIETDGTLDLRGFLGIDGRVPSGYAGLKCDVRLKGDGTPEQMAKIVEVVKRTSPNYWNITRAVPVEVGE